MEKSFTLQTLLNRLIDGLEPSEHTALRIQSVPAGAYLWPQKRYNEDENSVPVLEHYYGSLENAKYAVGNSLLQCPVIDIVIASDEVTSTTMDPLQKTVTTHLPIVQITVEGNYTQKNLTFPKQMPDRMKV